jgi:hypothetical protein
MRIQHALVVLVCASLACGEATGPTAGGLQILTAPSASAVATQPLQTQPIIQATDAAGNPMAISGLVVTANIQGTGGFVLSGGTATTDATGAAVFETLTLGSRTEGGVVALRFSAPGIPSVTTDIDLSCEVKSLFLGIGITDALVNGDCVRQSGSTIGSRFHWYDLTVPAGVRAIRVTDTTSTFLPVVVLRGPNEPVRFIGQGALQNPALSFRVLVPAGVFRVLATSGQPDTVGTFKLKIDAIPEADNTCEGYQFHSPLNTNQTLLAECSDANFGVLKDFSFTLASGASIATTLTSSAFTGWLSIWRVLPDGLLQFETEQIATGTTASINFTNATTTPQIYVAIVGSENGTQTGDFNLQATITNPAASVGQTLPFVVPVTPNRSRASPGATNRSQTRLTSRAAFHK